MHKLPRGNAYGLWTRAASDKLPPQDYLRKLSFDTVDLHYKAISTTQEFTVLL
jgi:hypothetical protein